MRKKKIQTEVHIIQPQHVQSQSLPWLRLGKEKKIFSKYITYHVYFLILAERIIAKTIYAPQSLQ